ncbi:MAG TPA: PepSY domain-containing protein [Clostridia bacterium]|nr:PepSY domain-containing protein [Clostridia bacterium]
MKYPKISFVLILMLIMAILAGCATTSEIAVDKQTMKPESTALQADAPQSTQVDVKNNMSEQKAREIALSHAGLSEAGVTFIQSTLVNNDGRNEYEFEFTSAGAVYDYRIDATSGEIIAYDKDAEHRVPEPSASTKPGNTPENDIGADAAKKIALEHAGFSKDEVTRLSAKLDYDDGKWGYDVKYYVGRIEYSYEIDAVSGKVLSYEAEQDD